MAGVDPAVQDKILQDPQVQAAVKKAGQENMSDDKPRHNELSSMRGEDALSDPAVQAEILKVAKEKFPEAASAAKDKIMEWANDPEVQKQAYQYAGIAAEKVWQSVSQVGSLIEQGPAGVRVLAFVGGVAALAQSIWVLLGLMSPISASTQIPKYVVHFYQLFFATTTMLFEAKPEWIQKVPGLNDYQDLLINKAKFLAEATGRGLFYGFQGTLFLCFGMSDQTATARIGLWFLFMAMLHILMGFGVMPQEVAKKMQEVRQMDPKAAKGGAPDEETSERPQERKDQEPLLGGGAQASGTDATPASKGQQKPVGQSSGAARAVDCLEVIWTALVSSQE
eukprot:g28074.t1